MTKAQAIDTYQCVTDKIVAALETAQRWQKPWTSAFGGDGGILQRPVNAVTGKPYQGINVPLLWSAARAAPHWATYKAWQSVGAQVRKGERASLICFWQEVTRDAGSSDEDGEGGTRKYLMCRTYSVFNAEQVDGWSKSADPVAPAFDPIANADAFVSKTGATIRHGGDRAFYTSGGDFIQMPHLGQFIGTKTSTAREAYYGTLFHELTHWSGHASRCNRQLGNRFGSEAYAAEELIAELGAAFLSADHLMHREPREDHAGYLANWLKVLRSDKRAIFTAASKAEQAVRFLNEQHAASVPQAA